MRTYDLSPLYRNFVGLDRMANLLDAATQSAQAGSAYPPYNVAQLDEDTYRIELAVAGFTSRDIDIETHDGVLSISGGKTTADNDEINYLHRGIAERRFERRFQLADHVRVENADLRHGLLVISLKREVPDALKPRKIAISGDNDKNVIKRNPSGKAKAA